MSVNISPSLPTTRTPAEIQLERDEIQQRIKDNYRVADEDESQECEGLGESCCACVGIVCLFSCWISACLGG